MIKKTASLGLVVIATKMSKTLEGKWVNIMVAIAPILDTNLEDITPLIPPTILQTKRRPPTESRSKSYFF